MMKKLYYIAFIFCTFYCISQNKTIDSLLNVLKITKADPGKISILNKLSWNYFLKGNYAKASVYIEQSIALSNGQATQGLTIQPLLIRGVIYEYEGSFGNALEYYQKALKLCENIGDKRGIASALNNIGNIHQLQGNNPRALEYLLKSLRITEALGNKKDLAAPLDNIGLVYCQQGDFVKALEYHERSTQVSRSCNDKYGEISSTINAGNALMDQKEYAKALDHYQRALSESGLIAYEMGVKTALQNIGDIHNARQEYPEAIKFHQKALEKNQLLKDRGGIALCLATLGSDYAGSQNYPKALDYYKKSLSLSKEIGSLDNIREAYKGLHQVYSKMKMYGEAYENYKAYTEAKDSLVNEGNIKKIVGLEKDFEFEKKELAAKLGQDKKEAALAESNRKQKIIITGTAGALLLLLTIAFLLVRQNKFRAEQKSLQLEQKLLRSQMNPHFIFNALQAIQNYILRNDQKEAVKYLSSFAHITRSVLENSRIDQIPLKKEIVLLENYLHLQKLRFDKRFDYKIHVDPEIDIEKIELPPMLSQPFIENALEHGMRDIEEGGMIDIYFTIKDHNLLLEIKDNGKGMESDVSVKQHRSLALEITKERVELMNLKKDRKTIFSISEAFPGLTSRKGVKVQFYIPV